jgi:dihydroxyacetone kinase
VKNGYKVPRVFSGTLMTSINGHGFSITILKLVDDSWLELLDTSSHISSLWKATSPCAEPIALPSFKEFDETKAEIVGVKVDDGESFIFTVKYLFVVLGVASKIEKAIRVASEKLIESEEVLNKLDSSCGDGDCGSSLKEASTGKYLNIFEYNPRF